jgi:hypothetical protein
MRAAGLPTWWTNTPRTHSFSLSIHEPLSLAPAKVQAVIGT